MENSNSNVLVGNEPRFINIDENPIPSVRITNLSSSGDEKLPNESVRFTYRDENQTETLVFERPEAELNIFDYQYYLESNPDVAQSLSNNSDSVVSSVLDSVVSLVFDEPNLPNIVDSASFRTDGSNTISFTNIKPTFSPIEYSGAIEHYVSNGASEERNPNPLFDIQYYLGQNPDVASALAGGEFEGDPLLHYVSVGADRGLDPNEYFDSDYYLEQNSDVADAGYNPLEHYVLLGSSEGRDPSPNFDANFYLSQNQDVAAAGIDPLTHFLIYGENEGRLPMAG